MNQQASSVLSQIIHGLKAQFKPQHLTVKDFSHLHAGHNSEAALGETHFNIFMVSDVFHGEKLINRHRMVIKNLESIVGEKKNPSAIAGRVHAVEMNLQTPSEYKTLESKNQ